MIGAKPSGRGLITGGAGFLGRGVMRTAREQSWPCSFTVYSRDEYKQDLCRQKFPDARYVIGDIRDTDRLTMAMYDADFVVHAAAMKYIPEAEANVGECVSINIDGSRSVLKAAKTAGVQKVVGISTDKACLPVNTYGITKAVMERLFDEYSYFVNCSSVRYGNVVGSTGSVIPVFQRQLKELGKVQVTNPYMTRYWISISDAVELVVLAFNEEPGSIIIPMPSAMQTGDLAKMIAGDNVIITGVRPGEKTHENLMHQQESIRSCNMGTHYVLRRTGSTGDNQAFVLSSGNPTRWLNEHDMQQLMEDAKCV